MTVTEVLEKINAKLNENPWWARFVNSQFAQMMAVLGAQVIYIAQTYASRALGEGFISTATRRSSILAAAEDRGYIGRFITPSEGSVTLKNNSDVLISLPDGAEFLSPNLTPLALVGGADIQPGESVTLHKIKQWEAMSVSFDIEADTRFLTLMLTREITAEVAALSVVVVSDGEEEKWNQNQLFRMSRGYSRDYALVYKPTEQLGVRFGDGSMGMMPPMGAVVRVDIKASVGDFTLAEGQKLECVGNISQHSGKLEATVDTIITGGEGLESTEETRARAKYYVPFDEQVIWGGDYRTFLIRAMGNFQWLNVWGEAIQEKLTGFDVYNINRIYFCGNRAGVSQQQLSIQIMDALTGIPNELNKHFEYVPTDEYPFTVEILAVAKKDVLIADAMTALKDTMTATFGRESDSFKDLLQNDDDSQYRFVCVRVKDIWRAVEELDLFLSYEVTVRDMKEPSKMNDFMYMDVDNSEFVIIHQKSQS